MNTSAYHRPSGTATLRIVSAPTRKRTPIEMLFESATRSTLAVTCCLLGSLCGATAAAAQGGAPLRGALVGQPTAAQDGNTGWEDRSTDEDASSTPDFLWVEAEGGYSYLNLRKFDAGKLLESSRVEDTLVPVSGRGLSLGAGAGLRFFLITTGARVNYATLSSELAIGSLTAEVGLRLPVGALQPYFRVHTGYAWYSTDTSDLQSTDVDGWTVGGGFGVQLTIGGVVQLGAGMDGEFLDLTGTITQSTTLAELDGRMKGLHLRARGSLGLSF